MTRKEALDSIANETGSIDGTIRFIEQIYDDFEDQLKELTKSKTCDGCKFNRFGCDSVGVAVDCVVQPYGCSRNMLDRYEIKDSE